MAIDPVTILHISDPQFGKNHAFGHRGLLPGDKVADSLAERLKDDLFILRMNYGVKPDLVIITGDITETGAPSEFQKAHEFLEKLANTLHLDKARVVLLPGNHDINRAACEAYFLLCTSKEVEPTRPYWNKYNNYSKFYRKFYESTGVTTFTKQKPWGLFEMPDLQLVVAALNSTMAESHRDGDHFGWVGEQQLIWFGQELEKYKQRGWLRIGAIHHNVHRAAVDDDENLRDTSLKPRLEPCVNLLLHGHTHNGGQLSMLGTIPVVSTGSTGVISKARPVDVPNQYQIIQIYPDRIEQFARRYSPTDMKWVGDTTISPDGGQWRQRTRIPLQSVEATFAKHRIRNAKSSSRPHAPKASVAPNNTKKQEKLSALTALRLFFSTGTAEGEGNLLKEAFVTPQDYIDIITPPATSPRVLLGKKGSGKSAFITVFLERMATARVPAILLRPDDLKLEETTATQTVSILKAHAYNHLVRTVAFHIWAKFPHLLSSQDRALLGEAEKAERLPEPTVSRLRHLIAQIGADVRDIDIEAILGDSFSDSHVETFRARVMSDERVFYLLIDDTDQLTSLGHLDRIWGFFLAVRRLTSECHNVKCIVTLRSEIWRRLEIDSIGQRDQMDHFRPLTHLLNPSKAHIQHILERRLEIARARCRSIEGDSIYAPFFEGSSVKIPTSHETSSWKEFLLVRSRSRPRDVIQLVSLLAEIAGKRGASKINSDHVEDGMIEFSKGRVYDIAAEVGDECPQFVHVVQSLSRISFKSSVEEVRQHLLRLPSTMSIKIRGSVLAPDDQSDMLKLWSLLYETGVLNARIADSRQPDGFRHLDPIEEPNFVSQERWNAMQAVLWEVNPVYRDYLLQTKRSEEARDGLPPVSRHKDKK